MPVRFEVGTSVTLVGNDLQFVGETGAHRVHFVVLREALKRLAGTAKELSPQEKFRVYDRNREWLQDIARRLHEGAPRNTKTIKIHDSDI
jgi:hypothetical protein